MGNGPAGLFPNLYHGPFSTICRHLPPSPQGDLEAELRLPVTPFMDRRTACIPKQQLGFYNFIARPMFEAMDQLVSMEAPLSNLDLMCARMMTSAHDYL